MYAGGVGTLLINYDPVNVKNGIKNGTDKTDGQTPSLHLTCITFRPIQSFSLLL